MADKHNERRSDHEMRRLFEAIEKVGQDCQDQHVETQKTLDDITMTQTVFGEKIKGIESTLNRIGLKVDHTAERVAATDSTVQSLRNQNATQFEKIGELEGEVKVLAGASPSEAAGFIYTDNFRWLIGSMVFVSLLVLLAYGAITPEDLKSIKPDLTP